MLGKFTEASDVQPSNAFSDIVVIPSGIVTDVIPSHPLNDENNIPVTVYVPSFSTFLGITKSPS